MKKVNLTLDGQFKHNNIGTTKFKEILTRVLANPSDQMALILGAPGVGKTQIVYGFIKDHFGRVIDQGEFKREGGINLVVLRTEDMDRSSLSLDTTAPPIQRDAVPFNVRSGTFPPTNP